MKKTISIILSLLLLLGSAGCNDDAPVETSPATEMTSTAPAQTLPTESTEPTDPQTPVIDYQAPMIAAATAPITEQFKSSDGATLLHYTYQDLMLTLPDPQVADAIVMDYLNLVDPASSATEKVLRDAKKAYAESEDFSAYNFKRIFHPMRLDSSVLSFYGTQTLNSGHGTSAGISVTYDLVTGQQLSLKQILCEDFSADSLAQLIVDSLSGAADEGILYSDYAYVIAEKFSSNTPVDSWYLSDTGLCFYFAPYEIAPYNAGTVVAQIPYELLNGLLKDAYFPEEQVDLVGTVTVTGFSQADLSGYTQFAELILDPKGDELLLCVDGAVKNLRIEVGQWQKDGTFITEATVFASATLCQTDALMLQLSSSEFDVIRVTYESDGAIVSGPLAALLLLGDN